MRNVEMDEAPFYDPKLSYEDNYDKGPFGLFGHYAGDRKLPDARSSFLGFPLRIPFGIPAGPLVNSRYVEAAWRWGFSLATYKTVRPAEHPSYPFPNVIKVSSNSFEIRPGESVKGDFDISTIDVKSCAVTNSFGVPSKPVEIWQKDVGRALSLCDRGDLLILSFMGADHTSLSRDAYRESFAICCQKAKETGAPILEVNLSCPNIAAHGVICNDLRMSRAILEAINAVRGNVPCLVKIGYVPKEPEGKLERLLDIIHQYTDGVVAINTIQANVVGSSGRQKLPGSPTRLTSGICGASIRWAGLEMAGRIVSYKRERGWNDFVVVGVGGVVDVESYRTYMRLGVDAVQSATGAMFRPTLAQEITREVSESV